MFSDGTASIPFLKDIPDACVAWWAELAELVTDDRAVARLEHLLVERRHGNVGQRARRAAEGYLGLADAPSLDAVEAVRTALDLALRTKQVGTAGDVLDRTAALAWQALQEDRPAPGVVLGFIDVLIEQGGADHDVAAMLERARTLYRGRPHQVDSVIQRQPARVKAQPEASRQLWSDRVDVWIAAGEAVEPLVRVTYLQDWIRRKWLIENQGRHVRDVTLREDSHQVGTGSGPGVIATLRNTAIGWYRTNGDTNIARALRRSHGRITAVTSSYPATQ